MCAGERDKVGEEVVNDIKGRSNCSVHDYNIA
jgi:hypothetical protein